MNVKIWFAVFLACGMAAAGTAQEGAPALSAADAQSLKAAMQVIQNELNAVGRISFVEQKSDEEEKETTDYSEQLSNVVANPAACAIHYHFWRKMHGEVVNDEDVSLSLHDFTGVWEMSIDEAIKRVAEQEGPVEEGRKNDYYDRFVPTVYMVMMRFANNDGDALDFADLKQAQLVGEAMTQAVKLCGGKQEPF